MIVEAKSRSTYFRTRPAPCDDGRVVGLHHGYTNDTRRLRAGVVEKKYAGSDAADRSAREYLCLSRLSDRLPVPRVIDRDASVPALTLAEVQGTHGQDAIDAGNAAETLRLIGSLLRRLQGLDPASVPGLTGVGDVIVHGDFGPQNVLIDDSRVSALLDWEFAHIGSAVEDLAWAEWIVRMHHPRDVGSLPELFRAAQAAPAWNDRQAAMVGRCRELLGRAERAGSDGAIDLWRRRTRRTERWRE